MSPSDDSILGEGDTAKLEMKASAHRSARTASQRLPAGSLRGACVQPAQHALQHRRLSANGRARFAAHHRQGGEDADAHRSRLRHEQGGPDQPARCAARRAARAAAPPCRAPPPARAMRAPASLRSAAQVPSRSTSSFIEAFYEGADGNLIGQFGRGGEGARGDGVRSETVAAASTGEPRGARE